ncbi:hypothetical protein ABMA71_16290, partial [Halobacteriovorax sp. ZH3_bin.1]
MVAKKTLILFLLPFYVFAEMDISDCIRIKDLGYEDDAQTCVTNISKNIGKNDDCIDCLNLPELPKRNPWAETFKVAIPALAALGGVYFQSKYAADTQEHWANAYENGKSSCYGAIDTYQGYLDNRGANPLLAKEQNKLMAQCNGYGNNMYAGGLGLMNGTYGGMYGNPYLANGYSQGMLNGMYGPYGSYANYNANANINLNPFGSGVGAALAGLLTGRTGVNLNGNLNIGGYGNLGGYGNGGFGAPVGTIIVPMGGYGNGGYAYPGGITGMPNTGGFGNLGINLNGNWNLGRFGNGGYAYPGGITGIP